jgi:hypothetical protein
LEIGNWKLGIGNRKSEIGNRKQESGEWESQKEKEHPETITGGNCICKKVTWTYKRMMMSFTYLPPTK